MSGSRLDYLCGLTPVELVDLALMEPNRQRFWLYVGMFCGSVSGTNREDRPVIMRELWATAYVQPDGDWNKAVALMRAWKEGEEQC